jgi:hypothetical protein
VVEAGAVVVIPPGAPTSCRRSKQRGHRPVLARPRRLAPRRRRLPALTGSAITAAHYSRRQLPGKEFREKCTLETDAGALFEFRGAGANWKTEILAG